jgi:hypothetical protein
VKRKDILTVNNTKIKKSKEIGYLSAILHLAPADSSGYEVCPSRSKGCTFACNNGSGRGRFDSCQLARINKTRRLFEDRENFLADLHYSIKRHVSRSKKEGLLPAIRLNGTSDLPWFNKKFGAIIQAYPQVQFYDYTKVYGYLKHQHKYDNYYVAFSKSEVNDRQVQKAIKQGYSIAVSFELDENKELPKTYMGLPVVNGDLHDAIFIYDYQCILGLRFKQPRDKSVTDCMKMLKRDTSGFTVLYDGDVKEWFELR